MCYWYSRDILAVVDLVGKLCLVRHLYLLVSRLPIIIDVADNVARPGLLNALLSLLTIVVNVVSVQDWHFLVTAKITITVITI